MSMHRLSGCPSCAEPLEEGDRFCGVCGYAVSAAPDSPAPGGYAPAEARGGSLSGGPAHARPGAAEGVVPSPGAGGLPAPSGPDRGGSFPAATRAETQAAAHPDGTGYPVPSGPAVPGERAPDGPTAAGPGAYDVPGSAAVARGAAAHGLADRPEAPEGSHPGGDREPYGSVGDYPARPVPAPASHAGGPYGDHPEPAAPGSGYGSGVPAPGWGSVTSAAPTLVDEAGDWGGAPDGPDRAASWQSPPAPEPPAHEPPAHEPPTPGTPTPGPAGPGPANPEPPAYESPAHESPYAAPHDDGSAQESPYGAPQGDGKTCVACRAGHVDTDGYCEHCGHAQPRERDHLEEELGSVAAVSDRGLRHHRNEDSFAVAATALPDGSAATVAIVCDGVSSASRPDEASAAAAGAANEALLEALPRGAHPQEAMHEAILAAAAAVNALAPEVPGAQNAPACTLVGAVVSGGVLTIGWVGDSRAYWVPDDRAALPRRLTEDDSWAAQMVAAGLMGEAEAYADVRAHAITGWLGADAYDLEPHTASFKPDHAGVVVVCTDGLWNYAESAREMAQVLPPDAATRPLHSAQVLVGHALDGGGHDNVTVAVVPFAAAPGPSAHAETEA
ncbi:protein phosphatase 2C domain-containing protein [Streptomyces sp. NPDC058279]|uniref:protein phosphatase 2C domain-containing protein n=1 Tax=Streptomyces sp. NPDC058279 TaxID=3346418 RepID=UPI0036DFCA80